MSAKPASNLVQRHFWTPDSTGFKDMK